MPPSIRLSQVPLLGGVGPGVMGVLGVLAGVPLLVGDMGPVGDGDTHGSSVQSAAHSAPPSHSSPSHGCQM